jgi:hypothetical protein
MPNGHLFAQAIAVLYRQKRKTLSRLAATGCDRLVHHLEKRNPAAVRNPKRPAMPIIVRWTTARLNAPRSLGAVV